MRIANLAHGLTIGGTVLGGAFAIEAASLPILSLDGMVLIFLMALPLGMLWGVSLILEDLSGRRWRPALIAPMIAVTIGLVIVSGVPKQLRVALSEGALSQIADAIEGGTLQMPEYQEYEPLFWAGAIPIYGVWAGETHLVAGFTGSDTPAGLVRLTGGPPVSDPIERRNYQHLFGRWYRWWY